MKIILAGGGSGGHTFPLIAITRQLKKYSLNELDFLYIGPKDPFTLNFLAKEGVQTSFCRSGKIRRYGGSSSFFSNLIDIIFNIPIGVIQAFITIFFENPDLIFSKGGFGSLPVVIAGALLGVPIVLHESDVVPGKTNRFLSGFAGKIYVAFPEKQTKYFSTKKMMWMGNPIRENILNGSPNKAKQIFNLIYKKPTILILGGSQGSQRINELIISISSEMLKYFEIIHQTGSSDYKRVNEQMNALLTKKEKLEYHVYPFLDEEEMKNAYAASDLIVARSGSGTIFEISAIGRPSILIPLPESAQGHQLKNALTYSQLTQSSIVIEEKNLTPHFFLGEIKNVFEFKNIQQLSENARMFSKPDSAEIIAKDLLNILES
jgi:UDP-N-acetylglucosamine--N-acetylmuramyl-(pentapeptide) pyrophosphoryl-undecaprenol N-acetylglucosamine transferase